MNANIHTKESAVLAQLTEILDGLEEGEGKVKSLTLTIQAGARTYKAMFTVSRLSKSKFALENPCIVIHGSDTHIYTDAPAKGCFTPTLVSDPVGTPHRITATDVLQVLKTKLLLSLPTTETTYIHITDVAKIDGASISAWRLLRGELPLYAKYGYTSAQLEAQRNASQETRWSTVRDTLFYIQPGARVSLGDAFVAMTGGPEPDPEMTVSAIMQTISLEMISSYGARLLDESKHMRPPYRLYPSDVDFGRKLLDAVLRAHGTRYKPDYTLDTESAEWLTWSSRIRITGLAA